MYGKANGIKAVFFDLGKVILRFTHDDIVTRLLSRARPEDRIPGELFKYLFDAEDGLCNMYDEGTVSSEGFYEAINGRFPLGVDYEGFVPLWNDIFTENTDVSAIIRQVRARRPVYLLSNVNDLHWEFCKARFPVLSEMDGWVLSYEVKAKKPNPEIYAAALRLAGAKPGETVFIDDLAENTASASRAGIKGITFHGAEALLAELKAIGLVD